MGRRKILFYVAALTGVECFAVREALAWDPFASVGTSVGRGLAQGATPTLEAAGHKLIADVNGKLAQRVDQLQGTLSGTVSELNVLSEARLNQADGIMQARIVQIEGVAHRSIGAAVGGLDLVAKNNIARLEKSGIVLIQELKAAEIDVLNHADEVLQDRIGQLDEIVGRSLEDVDEILRKRIEQVDEMTERRLGNVDVIATQQGVALESSLLQIGKWLALLAFAAYVCIKGYEDFDRYQDEQKRKHDLGQKGKREILLVSLRSLGKSVPWLGLRLGAAALCIAVVYLFITKLPTPSQNRLTDLIDRHSEDFQRSCASLDFPRVRFHESQLQLLETDRAKRDRYRYETRKYELARDVLTRPALLKTQQGVREVVNQVRALERPGQPDADVLALQAYISYRVTQSSESRSGEWEAADLARQALTQSAAEGTRPVFKPLAAGVLRALLEDPVPESGVALHLGELRQALAPHAEASFTPLKHIEDYDRAVIALNQASSRDFIRLLDAQVAVRLASQKKKPTDLEAALDTRLKAAQGITAAWTAFDDHLRVNHALSGSTAAFAAFTLNDAVLTQALWVELNPKSADLAPHFNGMSVAMRVRVAPVRIEWARRYAGSLGRGTGWMFGFEESRRFDRFDRQVRDFIEAYLKLRAPEPRGKAKAGASTATAPASSASPELQAALAAAALGLYDGDSDAREAYGLKVLGPRASKSDRDVVLNEYGKRRLQLL